MPDARSALLTDSPTPIDLFRRQTILLVDDEADILESLKFVLESFLPDVDVRTADSGHRALESLAEKPVDLIVSDYRMPEMNGLEFLGKARTIHPNVPRILIT